MTIRSAPPDLQMSAPDVTARERELVERALAGPDLSMGPMLRRFESEAARIAGCAHGIAVSSGTAGLHVAVRALGIGAGARVLTTAYSFVASVNCFLYEGAVPVFADIDPITYGLDPASADDSLRRAGPVAALLPVHVFGQPCDMTGLAALAAERGVPIIEDACEAIGATHAGRPTGSLGRIGVFAFYPNKQVTTGEGGVIVTDDEELARLTRSLRNQGRGEGEDWFDHVRLGYNYRLGELAAALGVAQLERLDEILEARARVAAAYSRRLARIVGISTPTVVQATTRMSWFVYVVALDRDVDRDEVVRGLARAGVPTRAYFRPIHLQPYFRQRFGDLRGSLPVTEDIGRRTLALPFHNRLSDESVEYVAEALERALERAS